MSWLSLRFMNPLPDGERASLFHRLLGEGRSRNDLVMTEQAYCGLAVVYALRRDSSHSTDMLRQPQGTAMMRGDNSLVEQIARLIDELLAPGAVHSSDGH